MPYEMKPLSCVPGKLKGLSEQAHRQPLREQLRRRGEAPERDHRTIGIAGFCHRACICNQRIEARGADREQLDDSA